LASRQQRTAGFDAKQATKWATAIVDRPGYQPMLVDPPPGKSGLVRDIGLRRRLRECLCEHGIDPDEFSKSTIKSFVQKIGFFHKSGVPIKTVVLLRTMNDPVVIDRLQPKYASDKMVPNPNPNSLRAYVGGNNHHIEIRVGKDKKDREVITGMIVTGYEAARRKLARFRMIREEGVPKNYKDLSIHERQAYSEILRAAEMGHPIIDRRDDIDRGGEFLISLGEGETLWMRHKGSNELGYFVVAKLEKPNGIVLVPHWDARKATGRKDAEDRPVTDSSREQFTVVPSEFRKLAPPGFDFVTKVRVSPLGTVKYLVKD